MSKENIEAKRSYWWSRRNEFGKQVLQQKRNQMGLTQQQIANRVGLSQSRISRIERGDRPKDLPTAEAIATGYQFDAKEEDLWFQLFSGISPITKNHVPDDTISAEPLLEAYTRYARTIYQIRSTGNPELAIETASTVSGQLENLARDTAYSEDRPAFLNILAEVLHQQGWAYSETCSKDSIWAYQTGYANRLRKLAQEFNYYEFNMLADSFLGDSYYIRSQYDKAITWLTSALAGIHNEEHKLMMLLTLGKIWGFLKEEENFKKVELEVKKLINEDHISNLETLCWTFGSLARAQGYLGLPEAFRNLEEAKVNATRLNSKNQKAHLRIAQLVRDEFEVIAQLDPNGHYHYLEQQGKKAISLAQLCQCQRLADHLQKFLYKTFN